MPTRKAVAQKVLFQRRILMGITGLIIFGFLLWLISIGTDSWTIVECGNGSRILKTKKYLLQSHNGIWRRCMTQYIQGTKNTSAMIKDQCLARKFSFGQKTNATLIHYNRSIATFSVISILMVLMGIAFSIYSFRYTRYMYKRLAACGHFMGGGCVLIVLEVCQTAAYYSADNLPARHPPGCTWSFGSSFVLGWLTFTCQLIGGIIFLLLSRKRKRDKAPDRDFAIGEEPTIIGR